MCVPFPWLLVTEIPDSFSPACSVVRGDSRSYCLLRCDWSPCTARGWPFSNTDDLVLEGLGSSHSGHPRGPTLSLGSHFSAEENSLCVYGAPHLCEWEVRPVLPSNGSSQKGPMSIMPGSPSIPNSPQDVSPVPGFPPTHQVPFISEFAYMFLSSENRARPGRSSHWLGRLRIVRFEGSVGSASGLAVFVLQPCVPLLQSV